MARMVEARSLASLNDIADAPPANPPLQLQGEQPLVLYIARVPGSRDIFLTTMKPREKVVSAHDVESSLYYCHLTGDLDTELLKENLNLERQEGEYKAQDESDPMNSSKHDHSLPVLGHTIASRQDNYRDTLMSTSFPAMNGSGGQTTQRIKRKPIQKQEIILSPPLPDRPESRRKILGPRSMHQQNAIPAVSSQIEQNNWDDSPPFRLQEFPDTTMNKTKLPELSKLSLSPSHHRISSSSERHITLIRRDPATSDQWNVGKVSLNPRSLPTSPSRSPKRRNRDVILELLSPGYSKFTQSSDEDSAGFTSHLNLSSTSHDSLSTSTVVQPTRKYTFTTPWDTPCTFSTNANGRVLKCYHSLSEKLLAPSARAVSGGKPPSMLVSELRFNLPSLAEKGISKKKENRRPLSYSSPSFGKTSCSSLLSPTSRPSNEQDRNGTNLVSPKLSPRPVSYQDTIHTRPRLPIRPEESFTATNDRYAPADALDEDDSSDAELDLSLGQERAGGGFSGNKAKLGKLIIYGGQGLAMLDLLVSANMGVWFNDLLES